MSAHGGGAHLPAREKDARAEEGDDPKGGDAHPAELYLGQKEHGEDHADASHGEDGKRCGHRVPLFSPKKRGETTALILARPRKIVKQMRAKGAFGMKIVFSAEIFGKIPKKFQKKHAKS